MTDADKIKQLEERITHMENRFADYLREMYKETQLRKMDELPRTQEELIKFVKKYCDNYKNEFAMFIWEIFKQTHYNNEEEKNKTA